MILISISLLCQKFSVTFQINLQEIFFHWFWDKYIWLNSPSMYAKINSE